MRRDDTKSHCPVNFSLEIFGDSWSLLIIRDIVFYGKKTFREFLASDERIATNILTRRLTHLEQKGILMKLRHPTDGRKEIYRLTEKGLDLIPLLLEIGCWGAACDKATDAPEQFVAAVRADRERMAELVRNTVQRGGSVFAGEDSVMNQMKKYRQQKSQ